MQGSDEIIEAIRKIKHERAHGWYFEARKLLKVLETMDDPFGDIKPLSGNEYVGRHQRQDGGKAPLKDDFSDTSGSEIDYP